MVRTAARQKARGRRRRKKKCQLDQGALYEFLSRVTVISQLASTQIESMPETSKINSWSQPVSEIRRTHQEWQTPWRIISMETNNQKLLRQLIAITLILCLGLNGPHSQLIEASTLTDFDGATFYKAPVGSRVRIACNASHWHDDSISLVLWFKGGLQQQQQQHASNAQPIYTIDARQKPLSSGQARHLVADSLRGRARFVLPPTLKDNKTVSHDGQTWQVPYLDLAPLDADDQGEYRCRVDYRSRPRENFLIILFVLVPPSSLEIMDTNGRSLEQIYGPLNEGVQLTLLCLSKGGRPPPAILWKRNGRVIDDSYLTLNDFLALKLADGNGAGNGTQIGAPATAETRDSNLSATSDAPSLSSPPPPSSKLTEWPEFNYFVHSLATAPAVAGGILTNTTATATTGAISAAASRQQPEVVRTDRGRVHSQRPEQGHPLIDWQADRALTTGVNVLHLGELTRAQLTTSSELGPGANSSAFARAAGLPQLECHASNMHYDLHSLIKIFAPPSLLLQSAGGNSDAQTSPSPPPSPVLQSDLMLPPVSKAWRNKTSVAFDSQRLSAASAYAQAVERAILANLLANPADNELASSSTRQHEHGEAQARFAPGEYAAGAGAVPPLRTPEHQLSAAPAGATTSSEPLNWQQLIYQQLVRPHQLAIAAAQQQANSSPTELLPAASEGLRRTNATGAGQAPIARSKLIALEANLRPLDVKITSPARPLTAGQVHEFTCQSSGSRPPARMSWLKNGRPVAVRDTAGGGLPHSPSNTPLIQLATPTISQSRLALKLERQDHGARLSCRAENANFRPEETTARASGLSPGANDSTQSAALALGSWQLEDSITLNVHYAPRAHLELGNKMLSERIRENQDIYFVCQVDAEPPVTEITWLHNERPINETTLAAATGDRRGQQSMASMTSADRQQLARRRHPLSLSSSSSPANLILSNNSLVLQRAQLEQAGQYACLASNSEGVGLSNRLELRVLHAPVCVALNEENHAGQPASSNGLELHLGTYKMPPAGRPLKLTCPMLVPAMDDPQDNGGQLELSWYLGAASGPRRLLARQSGRDLKLIEVETMSLAELLMLKNSQAADGEKTRRVSHRAGNDDENDNDAEHSQRSATGQHRKPLVALGELTLDQATLWDDDDEQRRSELAAGQVYCLARNSMGDQKRSCVYAIERSASTSQQNSIGLESRPSGGGDGDENPQELEPDNTTAGFACLAVNVTASSVWIGCNSGAAARESASGAQTLPPPPPPPPALEISQVEENNDQLGRSAASAARFRFNVLVHSSSSSSSSSGNMAVTNDNDNLNYLDSNQERPGELLEANLSSHSLTEPLFAVVNLRPATNYLLDISDTTGGGGGGGGRSLVRLKTAPSSDAGALGKLAIETSRGRASGDPAATSAAVPPRPSIRQVTEPHPSDLVAAALISTRSTPARDNQRPAASPASNQRQQQVSAASSSSTSMWHTLTSTIGRMFAGSASRADAGGEPARGVGGSRRVGVAKGTQPSANGAQVAPIKWINLESADGLLALTVCIAVLLLTLIGLIALHRTWSLANETSQARASHYQDRNKRRASAREDEDEDDAAETKSEFLLAATRANDGDINNGRPSPPPPPPPLAQSELARTMHFADEHAESYSAEQKASLVNSDDCTPASQFLNAARYSTLQFQQRTFIAAQNAAKPGINFLRASSIANGGGGSLQRAHPPPAYGNPDLPDPAWMPMRASSVTRSRSSLGFQGQQLCEPLLLLAGGRVPARLTQPSGNSCRTPTNDSAGKQQLNNGGGGEHQSGKCLISDANLVFATGRSGSGGRRSDETAASEVYAHCASDGASSLCNCHELALMNLDSLANDNLDPSQLIAGCAGVHFAAAAAAASPSVDSNCTTSCSLVGGAGGQHAHHQADDSHWQLEQQHKHQAAHFVELLPPGSGQTQRPSTMMPSDDEQQRQQKLMIVGANHNHRTGGHQHHVLFNQSLNQSSSLGDSPAGIGFGSPQFSLTTNETTNTLSNPEPANFVLLADHQRTYAGASTKLGSGASTSNYSSDGSSSAMGAAAEMSGRQQPGQTRQTQPSKPRLTSILKQQQQQQYCKHVNASNNGGDNNNNNNNNYQQRASTNQPTTEAGNSEIVCQCGDNED